MCFLYSFIYGKHLFIICLCFFFKFGIFRVVYRFSYCNYNLELIVIKQDLLEQFKNNYIKIKINE